MSKILMLNKAVITYVLIGIVVVSTATGLFLLSEHFVQPKAELADIFIDSDNDFRAYDFKGRGTEESPYLIEGLHLNSEKQYNIHIRFTTKFFTIRNCLIENTNNVGVFLYKIASRSALVENNTFSSKIGIRLIKTNDLTIKENCFFNFSCGLEIRLSSNNTITENDFFDSLEKDPFFNVFGISTKIDSSQTCIFSNNSCFNSTVGLDLLNSQSIIAKNNNFTSNEIGMRAENSQLSYFINNIFDRNDEGLLLLNSPYSSLEDNEFISNGLTIDERYAPLYDTYVLDNNTVNNKEIGLFVYEENLTIDEPIYGQLIVVLSKNVTIQNQRLNNASSGLYLVENTNVEIINNTCNFNLNYGFYFERSHENFLFNNTANNNVMGLFLDRSNYSSIENNTINSNSFGLFFHYANRCNISGNTINYNIIKAITSERKCDYFNIKFNHFEANIGYAIFISDQLHYNIHHNSFINNALDRTAQCFDSPYPDLKNFWYEIYLEEGNYWNDWSGVGYYYLDGGGSITDRFPLSVPPV